MEIEEFLPPTDQSHGPVLARYLHSIRDTERRAFVHYDGAVKAYNRSTYPTDLTTFAGRGKGVHYRKVFRLDGPVDRGRVVPYHGSLVSGEPPSPYLSRQLSG